MSIKLNSVGGGSVTIQEPNTASDFTLSVPAQTANLLTSVSDLTTQVKSATNASGDAPVYACRAWVNFNGAGTVTIRASGNVSSITDNGTGDYTVNFTTAMPNVNYSQIITAGSFNDSNSFTSVTGTGTQLTTSCRPQISAYNVGTTRFDFDNVCVAIFR
jgi:hypothetical protein